PVEVGSRLRVIRVGIIEDVERCPAQFQTPSLAKREALEQRDVPVSRARTLEARLLEGPELINGRKRDGARVQPVRTHAGVSCCFLRVLQDQGSQLDVRCSEPSGVQTSPSGAALERTDLLTRVGGDTIDVRVGYSQGVAARVVSDA